MSRVRNRRWRVTSGRVGLPVIALTKPDAGRFVREYIRWMRISPALVESVTEEPIVCRCGSEEHLYRQIATGDAKATCRKCGNRAVIGSARMLTKVTPVLRRDRRYLRQEATQP